LAKTLELIVEGDPGAGHLGVHFAESTFPNATARAVAHELGTFSLERAVGNRRALMDTTSVLSPFFFSRNEDTVRHAA
jgi:hypothetical protein